MITGTTQTKIKRRGKNILLKKKVYADVGPVVQAPVYELIELDGQNQNEYEINEIIR